MNFDTFVPDLLVGLATGLIVGVVLLIAQSRAQTSKDRGNSQFAWESLKPKLSAAAHRTWVMSLDSMLPVPVALTALDDLVKSEPLSLWKSHLKKPDPALELVMLLGRQRATFESSATDIESSLGMLAAQYVDEGKDETVVGRLIRSRAYGFPDSEVHGTVSGPFAQANIARLTSMADAMAADPRMAESIARYKEVASIYTESIIRLRELLNPPEDDDEPAVVSAPHLIPVHGAAAP